jgi:ferric-dicitrate binding protein FerR (iron transport regulator)
MRIPAVALMVLVFVAPLCVYAASDKQLQNLTGSVSYQHGKAAAHTVAPSASALLADKDVAITGGQSQAAVILPDSSRVTMGSDTRVEMAFFNQAEDAGAKFILYQGKTRFKVEHPGGKPANYTFVTPTASIGVRGTEGDIGVDGQNLIVNVYGLSDPNLPVLVRTNDGKQYVIKAGQQLLAKWVNGKIQTTIDTLTQRALAQFDELGAPAADWAASAASLVRNPCAAAANQANNVLGGLFGGRVSLPAPSNCESPTPEPSPSAPPRR